MFTSFTEWKLKLVACVLVQWNPVNTIIFIFREGLCVVKVFAIQDPSLPLQTYYKHIKEISDKLQSIPSILPFQKIIITEKAGILVRQYIKDNLYDRIR
jgi:hypothetical protein